MTRHAELHGRLAHRPTITISPPDKAFFGLAFEHAIGLDLAVTPPYPQLLDGLDQPQANRLLGLAGYQRPDGDPSAAYPLWRKPTGQGGPARLLTAASGLAHLHQLLGKLERGLSAHRRLARSRCDEVGGLDHPRLPPENPANQRQPARRGRRFESGHPDRGKALTSRNAGQGLTSIYEILNHPRQTPHKRLGATRFGG
jgi:hypothetical protein